MAATVTWLPEALADVEAIGEYVQAQSPAYASAVVARIVSSARRLGEFPHIGHVVPEWDHESVRELVVYRYRLIYRLAAGQVCILAVIHGARELPEDIPDRR